MPNVGGKKFAYTAAGKKKAAAYKKKMLTKKQKTLPKALQAKIIKSKSKKG
jgi:hypothetical protein